MALTGEGFGVFGPRTRELLPQLTLDEKAALTAGADFFAMCGVERFGIADWLTTDGPNGARGSSFVGSGDSEATCIPCGSALGATWNPELVEELGALLGIEAREKGNRVLLAPTVNLHRSPLAGRNFECFSEDPLLSGTLAAAYVRGAQAQGVVTTVKHLVGNECETDRKSSNSIIDGRALRELYLVPFEMAVTDGGTLGVMTSYNRLNGSYCTEQKWLLTDVLRGEWGFEGLITTDWIAGADTVASAEAGVCVEMPAGDRALGARLAEAVRDGRVAESTVDALAGRMLSVFESLGALDDAPGPELSVDRPEHRALARRAAADAMVLLRNEPVDGGPVLPIDPAEITSIAVIGPNAARAQIMGGGSANLRPFHRTSPLDAFRRRLGVSIDIGDAEGCNIDERPPLLAGRTVVAPDGRQGFLLEVFDNLTRSGEPVATAHRDTSRIIFAREPLPGLALVDSSLRATTRFTPDVGGEYSFALTQVTPTRVLLDGEVIADGIASAGSPSGAFFGFGADVAPTTVELEAGRTYELVIETVAENLTKFGGLELRVRAPFPSDAIARAAAVARAADVAVIVVGTNDDWETEGEDRTFLGLPGDQDVLVSAVVAANPRTVVVVNTGAPVTMPWADDVPAIVQSWLGGQEMGDALVDVLTGEVDPGGRLPTTFPVCIEHNPSFGNFPGDNGQVRYAESIFVGYRWYQTRDLPVLWPFGHGLSYASFEIGVPELSAVSIVAGETVTVRVPIANSGNRSGSHVIQCYVRPHGAGIVRPTSELKSFRKVTLGPGESTVVELALDGRAFAYWDPAQPEWPELRDRQANTLTNLQTQERKAEPGWTIEPGRYEIAIANSVADINDVATVQLTA